MEVLYHPFTLRKKSVLELSLSATRYGIAGRRRGAKGGARVTAAILGLKAEVSSICDKVGTLDLLGMSATQQTSLQTMPHRATSSLIGMCV